MTQKYREDGNVVPVTLIEAGPCVVTQVKTADTDGYVAVQVGFGLKKHPAKPQIGHTQGLKSVPQDMKEFRWADDASVAPERGSLITVETFAPGDKVQVTGETKGKGYQGVVKRHGFHGAPASRGTKDQVRMPGSIGGHGRAGGRVAKGKRMAGRMGGEQVTIKNLEIVTVDAEKNLLAIKGALPGARGALLLIRGEGDLKAQAPEKREMSEAKAEMAVPETSATETKA